MYRNLFAFAIAVSFLFSACGGANSSQPQPNPTATPPSIAAPTAISYELVKDSLKKPNLTVRLHYYQTTGQNSEAINKHIRKVMGDVCWLGEENQTVEISNKMIFAEAEKFFKEGYNSDMAGDMSWEMEFVMNKAHTSKAITCLSFDNYSYMGGAHPSSYGGFVNIDNATGKILATSDIFDEAKLKPMVEKAFQAYWKSELKGSNDYEAAGFFVENNQLPLPEQIGFNEKGGVFYYNTYEIGAYAMGPTVLEIPYSELKTALKIEI